MKVLKKLNLGSPLNSAEMIGLLGGGNKNTAQNCTCEENDNTTWWCGGDNTNSGSDCHCSGGGSNTNSVSGCDCLGNGSNSNSRSGCTCS